MHAVDTGKGEESTGALLLPIGVCAYVWELPGVLRSFATHVPTVVTRASPPACVWSWARGPPSRALCHHGRRLTLFNLKGAGHARLPHLAKHSPL